MQTFTLKALAKWDAAEGGAVREYRSRKTRTLQLKFLTKEKTPIYVSYAEDMSDPQLVAYAEGYFEVSFAAAGTVYVQFGEETNDWGQVFADVPSQAVQNPRFEGHTTIMPRVRQSPEVLEMKRIMRINEMKRMGQQAQERLEFEKRMRELSDKAATAEAKAAEIEAKGKADAVVVEDTPAKD